MSDEQMGTFMQRISELEQDMSSSGVLIHSARLAPSEGAKVVAVRDGKPVVTDGPFAETKEQLGGFYIVEASDLDDALSWARRTSECIDKPIEVRAFADLRSA